MSDDLFKIISHGLNIWKTFPEVKPQKSDDFFSQFLMIYSKSSDTLSDDKKKKHFVNTDLCHHIVSLGNTDLILSEAESRLGLPRWSVHLASATLGMLLVHQFFEETVIYLIILIIFTYGVLYITRHRLHHHSGPLVAAVTVVYLITWWVHLTHWGCLFPYIIF